MAQTTRVSIGIGETPPTRTISWFCTAQEAALQVERHVADLVEEQRATARHLELAWLAARPGAGERRRRSRRAPHQSATPEWGYERPSRARRHGVYSIRRQLLSAARPALNEHRRRQRPGLLDGCRWLPALPCRRRARRGGVDRRQGQTEGEFAADLDPRMATVPFVEPVGILKLSASSFGPKPGRSSTWLEPSSRPEESTSRSQK
ncbi:hypothetical protein LJR084_006796 [Variovorax sp. LjRoot84]